MKYICSYILDDQTFIGHLAARLTDEYKNKSLTEIIDMVKRYISKVQHFTCPTVCTTYSTSLWYNTNFNFVFNSIKVRLKPENNFIIK